MYKTAERKNHHGRTALTCFVGQAWNLRISARRKVSDEHRGCGKVGGAIRIAFLVTLVGRAVLFRDSGDWTSKGGGSKAPNYRFRGRGCTPQSGRRFKRG